MKYSIIIPAFNAEDRIHRALDSIVNQDLIDKDEYEIIVVCDSCEDKTEAICQSYGAKTFPVEFHNDGLTRTKGIEVASGDWLLFMDDDDWWLHEYVLYTLDKVMEKEGTDVDIFLFGFVWKHKGIMAPLANAGRPFPSVWNKCWKRSFVVDNEIKFPKVYSISDLYFHTKAMSLNPKMKMFDTPLYYYNYMRKGSISETQFKGVDVYGKKK